MQAPSRRADVGAVPCLLLAAGRGERLRPVTDHFPKPLVPLLNVPLLRHLLVHIERSGIATEVMVNSYYRSDDVEAFVVGCASWYGLPLIHRRENTLTGPAGAMRAFLDRLDEVEHALVLSGDGVHDIDLRAMLDAHIARRALLTVAVKEVVDPGRFGVARLARDGRIVAFEEKPPLAADARAPVSAGIYCVSAELFRNLPPEPVLDFGADLIPMLADAGERVYGWRFGGYWNDVGKIADWLGATVAVLQGAVDLSWDERPVRPGLWLGEGATVAEGALVHGPVVVGAHACVHAGATVIGPVVLGQSSSVAG